jgi:hypothetical protein
MTRAGALISNTPAAYLLRSEGGRWQYGDVLPWARFDPTTRRVNGGGGPSHRPPELL